jgi:predicted Zn-dependent protease
MKLRWLAIAAGLAAFSAVPWTMAQTQQPGQNPGQTPNPGQTQTQTQTQTPAPVPDQDKGQPKAGDVQNAPAPPPANLPTQDDSQIKHDGTKTDVDAVGNRNVGCGRGVGNWYSIEKQVAMGRSYAQQIESQIKLVNDPVVTEYVNRIGQNLGNNLLHSHKTVLYGFLWIICW